MKYARPNFVATIIFKSTSNPATIEDKWFSSSGMATRFDFEKFVVGKFWKSFKNNITLATKLNIWHLLYKGLYFVPNWALF